MSFSLILVQNTSLVQNILMNTQVGLEYFVFNCGFFSTLNSPFILYFKALYPHFFIHENIYLKSYSECNRHNSHSRCQSTHLIFLKCQLKILTFVERLLKFVHMENAQLNLPKAYEICMEIVKYKIQLCKNIDRARNSTVNDCVLRNTSKTSIN